MPSTKSLSVILNDVALSGGSGSVTSGAITWTTNYGQGLLVKMTNGATGPTVAGQVQVQVSYDNTNYFNYGGAILGSTGNAAVVSVAVPIYNLDVMYVRVVYGSNTAQTVTFRVEAGQVTGI